MSTAYAEQEGADIIDQIEQQHVIDRASVEPESLGADERSRLLGYSKRSVPRRVYMLCAVLISYAIWSLATASAQTDILFRFICYFSGVDREVCFKDDGINATVANFLGVSSVLHGILALVISTYLSMLSDRLGRKPVMLGTLTLSFIAQASTWWLVFHVDNPPTYWVLLAPTVIDDLGGGLPFFVQMSIAYISDMVPDAAGRTRLVAYLEGIVFGTLALGPALGSIGIRRMGIENLYVVTVVGLGATVAVAFGTLKESLSNYHKRRNSTTDRSSVVSSFKLLAFNNIEDKPSRRNARLLLVCAIFTKVIFMSSQAIVILYPRRTFGWTAVETGYLVSIFSGTCTFWYLLGFPFLYSQLSKIWPIHADRIDRVDLVFLRVSLIFAISGYLLMGWARSPLQYFTGGFVDATSAMGRTVYTSALIKYLPPGRYGSFMAAFNFIFAGASVFTPMLLLKLYTWALQWRANLPYEVVSAALAFFFVVTLMLRPAL